MELLYSRPDGSYVALVNGYPYHIKEGDEPLWGEALATAGGLTEPLPAEPAPEPQLPTIDDYRRAIQAHIDATARQYSYDSGVTCASYVNSTNAAWAGEATAFVAWRDTVWAYAYAELAKVQAGEREQPTVETILSELPAMTWSG